MPKMKITWYATELGKQVDSRITWVFPQAETQKYKNGLIYKCKLVDLSPLRNIHASSSFHSLPTAECLLEKDYLKFILKKHNHWKGEKLIGHCVYIYIF